MILEQVDHKTLIRAKSVYRDFWTDLRHFVERHFVYYDTSSKVFVEWSLHRMVTSSCATLSNTSLG